MEEKDLKYEAMLEAYPDTEIIFGPGAAEQFAGLLNGEKASSVLVFTGSTRGAAAKAMPELQDVMSYMNLDFRFSMDIPAEPAVADVRRMVKILEEEKPQFVAALGGGSVMDAAKAAFLSWQSGLDVTELFGVNQAAVKCPGKTFQRVICLPTTAGTGSEATPYSNIVDPDSNVKKLIMEEQIIPSYAFVDPEYTVSMPKNLTLVTALDAMVHSIESILNRNALIVQALPVALKSPGNIIARGRVSAAATLGGMCIRNRPTSLPHLCSFSLYGKIPHGLAVAALLIPFWRYYLGDKAVRESTMEMAGLFSRTIEKTPEEVVDSCAKFLVSCGGPGKLSEVEGLDRSVIAKIAADAVLNPMKLQSCPRPMSPDNAEALITGILEKAW